MNELTITHPYLIVLIAMVIIPTLGAIAIALIRAKKEIDLASIEARTNQDESFWNGTK